MRSARAAATADASGVGQRAQHMLYEAHKRESLIMLTRLICMGIILNIALSSGVKRGLIGKKARPSPTTHQHPPPVTMPARPHAPKT